MALRARSANISTITRLSRHARPFCTSGGNRWRFGGNNFPFWGSVNSYDRAVKQRDETLKRIQAIKAEVEQCRRQWGPAIDRFWGAGYIRQLDDKASEMDEKVRQARRSLGNYEPDTESWTLSRLWPPSNESGPETEKKEQPEEETEIDPITNRKISRRPKKFEQQFATERPSSKRTAGSDASVAAPDLPLQSSRSLTEHDIKAIVGDELKKQDSKISAAQAKLIDDHVAGTGLQLLRNKLIPEALNHVTKAIDAQRPQFVHQVIEEAVKASTEKLREIFISTLHNDQQLHRLDVENKIDEHIPKLRALLTEAIDEQASELRSLVNNKLEEQDRDFRAYVAGTIEEHKTNVDYFVNEAIDGRVSGLQAMVKDAVADGTKSVTDAVMLHIQNHDSRVRALGSRTQDSGAAKTVDADATSDYHEKSDDATIGTNPPREMRDLGEAVPTMGIYKTNDEHFQPYNLGHITLLVPRGQTLVQSALLNTVGKKHPKKAAMKVLRTLLHESRKLKEANGKGLTLILAGREPELFVGNSSGAYQSLQRLQDTTAHDEDITAHNKDNGELALAEERPGALKASSNELEPLPLFKIVVYDPIKECVVNTDNTSSIPDSAEPLSAYELFDRLKSPSKFFPHYIRLKKKGYDIVSGSGDAIIFKHVRDIDRGRKFGHVRAPPKGHAASPSVHHNSSINPIDMTGGHLENDKGDWGKSSRSPRHARFIKGAITVALIAIGGKLVHDALYEMHMGESRNRHRDEQWPWEPAWRVESGQTERKQPPHEQGSTWRHIKTTL